MSQLDPSIYRKRRLAALGALVVLVVAIWGIPQLFASSGQDVLPAEEETQTEEPTATAELATCAPGVVTVEAMIGKLVSDDGAGNQVMEEINNFSATAEPYIWYEITNNGLVDCEFNVGARVTFFTISSGEQIYWTSRECDREGLEDLNYVLQANEPVQSIASAWDKSYSSSNGCSAEGNALVPTGGATFKIKAEVNGVISEEKRFILN